VSVDSPNFEGLDRWAFEPRRVEKPWGWELIWAEAEAYVGKILFVRAGQSLSLQFHNVKDESWYVQEGAAKLELGRHHILGRGEEASGGRQRDSTLADAFEALLGALYLDGDLETVRRFILEEMCDELGRLHEEPLEINPKGQLQELLQSISPRSPIYELLAQHGREHEKTFSVRVIWENQVLGEGLGRSKKQAESAAALAALKQQAWLKRTDPTIP